MIRNLQLPEVLGHSPYLRPVFKIGLRDRITTTRSVNTVPRRGNGHSHIGKTRRRSVAIGNSVGVHPIRPRLPKDEIIP